MLNQYDNFEQGLFIENRIINDILYFKVSNDIEYNIYELQNDRHPTLNYILGQLNLYGDLCFARNFLWRRKLENIFTCEFLFNKIFDFKLNKNFRSALTNLAHSMYIDYEPF